MADNSSSITAAVLSSGGTESLGWLNDIIKQMWPNINAAAATMVKELVEPGLREGLPGPLNGLKFTKISLGSAPPRFDNIDVFTQTEGSIKLNIDLHWVAEDFDIELATGIISAGVESIKIVGRLSVLMGPLVNTLPCIGAVQLAFINPPIIDLNFSGVASIADWSFVEEKITETVQSILASMLVLPNRMLTTLLVENDFCQTYKEPPGIARVTVVKGNNFRPEAGFLRKDVPDIYVKTKFGAFDPWQTSVQHNKTDPVWNERKDFVFSDDDQVIKVEAWDEDTFNPDDRVGTASGTVGQFLLDDDGLKTLKLADKDGAPIDGDITLQVEAYKCVQDLSSFELPDFEGNEHNDCICGFMIILVGKGIDIPVPKTYSTFVKVEWGPSQNFVTAPITDAPGIDATNPSYDTPFLIPLTQELIKSNKEHDVVFTVMNSFEGDETELGTTSVTFDSIMESSTKTITGDKEESIGDEGLKLRYQVSLRGLCK